MLSNHILSTTLLYGFHVTVRDYKLYSKCPYVLDESTMPYVLDVSTTLPLMIFMTQKVIECPKLLGCSDTYSQIKGLLIVWCQCDYTSVTSETIYELNPSCCRSKHGWMAGIYSSRTLSPLLANNISIHFYTIVKSLYTLPCMQILN